MHRIALSILLALCTTAHAANNITRGTWSVCRGAATASCTGSSQIAVGLATEQACADIIIARTDTSSTAYTCRESITALQVPPAPPVPTVSLTAAPNPVTEGSAATLTWSSAGATSCIASNGWSGARPTSGSESTGPLSAATAYTLTCNGTGGSGSASVTVSTQAAPPPGSQFGLEWPGTGTVRRMLYWSNPFPIYDATYIFRVLPKGPKTTGSGYWTTFFWGNNGRFDWDSGSANTYYGGHPYPFSGGQNWEVSAYGNDYAASTTMQWNRWYTQAFVAYKDVANNRHCHDFYYDLPDTNKLIRQCTWGNDPTWAKRTPPSPAIVMGQAPNYNGNSWGGYPGWEEFKGVIRGLQFYSASLSVADILNELTAPQSTAAGNASAWYVNLNPRPSDTTDKKVGGTPHHPQWDGTTATEWAQ